MSKLKAVRDVFKSKYPDLKQITLEDKEVFENYFEACDYDISEYTFSNLFMWRNSYDFRWTEDSGNLIIFSFEKDKSVDLFPPIGKEPFKVIKDFCEIARENDISLKIERVPEVLKKRVEESDLKVKIEKDRANWDYVYLKDNLVKLDGGDYQNIRQKVNKFKKTYNWRFETLSEKNLDECMNLHEAWCEERDCEENSSLIHEKRGVKEIFENWKHFNLTGGLLRVDGHIMAYCMYEKLCPQILVCHVEKANTDYAGAYNAINQITLDNIGEGVKWVNREQDLGIRGLRIAKKRYHPEKYVKKWVMHLNGDA